MDQQLTTRRLELRPIQLGDVEVAYELWTNADVRRFLFDDRVISLEDARGFVEGSVRSFAEHGYGLWLIFLRDTSKLIGFAGFLESSEETPNLIYGVHPDFCGSGFATEAAKAVMDFAFDTLTLASIKADVDEPNVVSVRVLEKLGMKRLHRAIVEGRPLLYYERRRDP